MTTITLNGIAAAHTVASAIAGHGQDFELVHGDTASGQVRADREYTELRLTADGTWASCTVTIERPSTRYGSPSPAAVSFSSAASGTTDTVGFARRSADLIAFAAQVAEQLNEWAAAGQLNVA